MASIWCYVIDFRSCAWNNCQGSNRTLCGSAMSRLVKFRGFILIIFPRASSSFSYESSPTPGLKGQISDIYWILIRIRREQLTDYYGEKIGTKNIILKANDKEYFANTEFVFTRQTFLHWKNDWKWTQLQGSYTDERHICKIWNTADRSASFPGVSSVW